MNFDNSNNNGNTNVTIKSPNTESKISNKSYLDQIIKSILRIFSIFKK